MPIGQIDGPIPGENFTSDTRNYPWHRPPDITDYDEGIEYIAEKMTEEDAADAILTFISMGVDVASLTDLIITQGIAGGKWTLDFGLLMAGPIAHIIALMCKGYDLEFDMGLKPREPQYGRPFLNAVKKIDSKKAAEVGENVKEQLTDGGGFMPKPDMNEEAPAELGKEMI